MLFHPGNLLLATGLPACYGAYRDYYRSLDPVLEKSVGARALKEGGRSLGAAVATRALGVATRGSYGVLALLGSAVFYASGCSTFTGAMESCRNWAQAGRERLTDTLGLEDENSGYNHPDYQATKGMTEEEQLEYLANKYFSTTTTAASETTSSTTTSSEQASKNSIQK